MAGLDLIKSGHDDFWAERPLAWGVTANLALNRTAADLTRPSASAIRPTPSGLAMAEFPFMLRRARQREKAHAF
jgi:hypothetical protein